MPGRAKGTCLLFAIKSLRAAEGPARAALDPALHHYLDERVLASSWYPETDYVQLLQALAQVTPRPPGVADLWDHLGVLAAQHDRSTLYRAQARRGDVLVAAKTFRDIFRMTHDGPKTEVTGEDPNVQIDVFDYETVSSEHCRLLTGYLREHANAVSDRGTVRIKHVKCRALMHDRCRWTLSR